MHIHDVAIIGAGPAGIAAAIQLRRYGMDFILLERDEVGGLLRNANWVENYPGFPHGISGPVLVTQMRQHLQALEIEATNAEVTSLAFQGSEFTLATTPGEVHSRLLVIASGTKPNRFQPSIISASASSRVFYEVYPLANLSGKKIAIVGGGDAAFDYALNLSRRNQVTILQRGEHPTCLPLLVTRIRQAPDILHLPGTRLLSVGELPTGELGLAYAGPEGEKQLQADYLIGALGRSPQLDFLPAGFQSITSELESQGLLYWAGDVKNGLERQTAIAVGNGIQAAMKIYRWLKESPQ